MSKIAETLLDGIIEAWNSQDLEKLRVCHAEGWIDHTSPEGMNDFAALSGMFQLFTSAFPDLELDIPKAIVNGNEVSYLYTVSGTHTAEFMGIPATGKTISIKGMTMLNIEEGKCAEAWGVLDMMSLMQQIGAIPTPG